MKNLDFYKSLELNTQEEVFNFFNNTTLSNNRTWDYYINWGKVFNNIREFKISLSILNSLCTSNDFENDLRYILINYPEVIKTIPILIGVRESKIKILDNTQLPEFKFKSYNFNSFEKQISIVNEYVDFFQKSGLKGLIIEGGITNLIDYAYGVEVGLDTNGRKNRGGTIMEELVYKLLTQVYKLNSSNLLYQGTQKKAKDLWGIELPVDKSSRRPDFIVNINEKIYWIETNFYSSGGSKLKSTCGEYKALQDFCRQNNVVFIWITDGEGWKTTRKPLEETFSHNDYIFNLRMIKEGVLNEVWKK